MTSINMRTPSTRPSVGRLRRLTAAYPVTAFSIMAFGLGWPLLLIRTTTDFASVPVGYAYTYVALLGSALVVTWAGGGRQAVGGFLARDLIWRGGAPPRGLGGAGVPALTGSGAGAPRPLA